MKNFNNINLSEGGEGEWKIPNNGKVYNANFRDDVEEQAKAEEEQLEFQTFSDESTYDFNKSETARGSMELDDKKIELFKQRMINQKRGMRTIDLAKVA